jgi:hypothetical protein
MQRRGAGNRRGRLAAPMPVVFARGAKQDGSGMADDTRRDPRGTGGRDRDAARLAARRLFEQGDMAAARAGFAACQDANPDGVAARRGVELCERFIAAGLPENWDGVVRLTSI